MEQPSTPFEPFLSLHVARVRMQISIFATISLTFLLKYEKLGEWYPQQGLYLIKKFQRILKRHAWKFFSLSLTPVL